MRVNQGNHYVLGGYGKFYASNTWSIIRFAVYPGLVSCLVYAIPIHFLIYKIFPYLLCMYIPSVPLDTPENFQASAGEREVTFSWSAPSVSTPVTGYTLSCSPPPSSLPLSFSQSGTHTLARFHPDTSYNCSLVAYNRYNIGPPATVIVATKEDCE